MTNAIIESIVSRSTTKYYDPAVTLSDDQNPRAGANSPLQPLCTLKAGRGEPSGNRDIRENQIVDSNFTPFRSQY
jgi:hypothetical protein